MLEWISNDCRKIKSKSWPDTTNANNQEPEITHGKKRTVVKKKIITPANHYKPKHK